MKHLSNGFVFAIVYIVFMLPTYILPYLGSNSALINTSSFAATDQVSPALFAHLFALAVLVVVTWFRGLNVGKKWLVIFPIVATIFDMAPVLNFIPLIPTVLHLIVIIKGVSEKPVMASPI